MGNREALAEIRESYWPLMRLIESDLPASSQALEGLRKNAPDRLALLDDANSHFAQGLKALEDFLKEMYDL